MTIQDQDPPKKNGGASIWAIVIDEVTSLKHGQASLGLVIADMRQRDQVGRERYGTPLQAHNGRDPMIDAYQEALDLAVYMRQAEEEGDVDAAPLYWRAIDLVFAIRDRLQVRAGLRRQ